MPQFLFPVNNFFDKVVSLSRPTAWIVGIDFCPMKIALLSGFKARIYSVQTEAFDET